MSDIRPAFNIFISVPNNHWLTPDQIDVKNSIITLLQNDGFEVQIMGEMGTPFAREKMWDFERAQRLMQCCQGFVNIGFARWHECDAYVKGNPNEIAQRFNLITEYSHFEGALAFSQRIPMLLLAEEGVSERGTLHPSKTLVRFSRDIKGNGLFNNQNFMNQYANWRDKVNQRYHLFFGYSGGAKNTAAFIINFLRSHGVRVRDWQDFSTAGTILEQIKDADAVCLGGLFLFTKDDILAGETGVTATSVPRDNVIFEAGYFVNSKGDRRVQIILEEGTKLLANLGGQIYLPLKDRNDTRSIETQLLKFVESSCSLDRH